MLCSNPGATVTETSTLCLRSASAYSPVNFGNVLGSRLPTTRRMRIVLGMLPARAMGDRLRTGNRNTREKGPMLRKWALAHVFAPCGQVAWAGYEQCAIDSCGIAANQDSHDRSPAGVTNHYSRHGVKPRPQYAHRARNCVHHFRRVVIAIRHAPPALGLITRVVTISRPQQSGRDQVVYLFCCPAANAYW
jgi:hypothetical protein